jgi:hypothetical protein
MAASATPRFFLAARPRRNEQIKLGVFVAAVPVQPNLISNLHGDKRLPPQLWYKYPAVRNGQR